MFRSIGLWIFLVLALPAFPLPAAPDTKSTVVKAPTGTGSITELGHVVLQALQQNDFDQLSTLLPGDAELKLLHRQGSEDLKAILENRDAESLRQGLMVDFRRVVERAMTQNFSWTDTHLMEARPGKAAARNRMLRPVTLLLQTKQNQPVTIYLEVIRINNRYYLFRGLHL